MSSFRPLGLVIAALASAIVSNPVAAQQDRDEWLENCRRNGRADRVRHCEIRDIAAESVGRLDVDPGNNGGVRIEAWEENSVAIEARIRTEGRTAEEAAALARELSIQSANGVVRVTEPARSGNHRSSSVSFVISAPRRTNVTAKARNGPVSMFGLHGDIRAEVVNGPLSLKDLGGDVRATTVNGPLHVTLGGSRWSGRGMDARAENGPLTLVVPENYSAELDAGTTNGPFVMELPGARGIDMRQGRRVRTTLGSGGPEVRVTTVNGPAVIRLRQDTFNRL